jgi:hypothetical protein
MSDKAPDKMRRFIYVSIALLCAAVMASIVVFFLIQHLYADKSRAMDNMPKKEQNEEI